MKKVLFVCVGNSARSQMAEAFFNHWAKGAAQAVSAGTEPAGGLAAGIAEAMRELGIDMRAHHPKQLSDELTAGAERIITMGCGVSCPVGIRIDEDWGLDDPAGQPLAQVRATRDAIARRVKLLLEQLGIPAVD